MANDFFMQKLLAGLAGPSQSYGGMLTPEDQKAQQQQAMLALGANLMAGGAPSPTRQSFGSILGPSLLAAQQAGQQTGQQQLQSMLLQSQIAKNIRSNEDQPNSVREYEFAKKNGFQGSFQDWVVAGGQSSRPSAVQEWEHYSKLMEDDRKNGTNNASLYLEMKRNPNFLVKDVNTVPTVIRPSVVAGTQSQALSTQASEAAAAAEKKRQESAGGALGTAEGNIAGGIETKGSNAVSTKTTIELAEPLIDIATGSAAGAARDKVAAVFGYAPDSAQAIAQLKVLQANLMTSMPRMEGPQSDRDVQLYREAAGQIGDPAVPAALKKAALRTVKSIQDKYIQRANQAPSAPPSNVVRKRFNPATGKIE